MGLLDIVGSVLESVGQNNAQQNNAQQGEQSGLMGILGGLLGGNAGQGGSTATLITTAITGLLSSSGGVDGLIKKFNDSGLSSQLSSWIGTGENKPISGEQISQVFDQNTIQKIASHLGMDGSKAANLIAQVLPEVINKATPDGTKNGLKNLG